MMTRFLALIGLLLIPQLTNAQYLQPEDLVNSIQPLPKSQEEANRRGEEQRQANIDRHPSTMKPYDSIDEAAPEAPEKPVVEEKPTLHPSPEEEPAVNNEEETDASELDPIAERLLRRLLQRYDDTSTQTLYPDGNPVMHSGALHAGAPLSGTGPETVAAGLTIAAGIGLTLWRAGKMKKLVRR